MNFIIIGDKYQKRHKSKGCCGLIKIDKNKNLFQYQYDAIKEIFPQAKIIYVGGFESKKIDSFIKTKYPSVLYIENTNYANYGDVYSLSLINDYLDSDTFIVLGYVILDKQFLKNFNINLGTQIVITPNIIKQTGCVISDNKIQNISLDLPNYVEDIYFLSKKDFTKFKHMTMQAEYRNYFIFELLNKLIDSGSVIHPSFYKTKKEKKYAHTK